MEELVVTLARRPNILLVVFDSLSAEAMQEHASDLLALTVLRAQGLNFENAYAPSPESSPARASLFTGLDMATHGVWTDGVALPKRETPIPEIFARNGYVSWLVGRRQLAGVSGWTTEHARLGEYHHFDWAHGPLHRSRQNAYLTWLEGTAPETYAKIFPRQANPDDTNIPSAQRQAIEELPDDLCFNTWVGQQVSTRIAGDEPFFGIASFVVGQSMGATRACVETLNQHALRQADGALAKIVLALPENTVIVVTAGRGSVKNAGSKQALQTSAIHVPLLLRPPNCEAQNIAGIVSTIDVAPTLYELAQVRPPQRIQGQSLVSMSPRDWSLSRLRNPDGPDQTALCVADWKLIVTHGDPKATYLYDLKAAADETLNLANDPSHLDTLENMMDLMIDARVAHEDRTEPRIAMF